MPKKGKKYREVLNKVDKVLRYTLEEGCKLLPETSVAKFEFKAN